MQEEAHVIRLMGKAHDHMMYVEGDDPLDVAVESLGADTKTEEEGSGALLEVTLTLFHFPGFVSKTAKHSIFLSFQANSEFSGMKIILKLESKALLFTHVLI